MPTRWRRDGHSIAVKAGGISIHNSTVYESVQTSVEWPGVRRGRDIGKRKMSVVLVVIVIVVVAAVSSNRDVFIFNRFGSANARPVRLCQSPRFQIE